MNRFLAGHRIAGGSSLNSAHSVLGHHPIRIGRQGIVLALLGIIVGLLLAANWQTKAKPSVNPDDYPRQVGAGTIDRLEAEQSDLKRQIADLRGSIAISQDQAAAQKSTLSEVNQTLEEQKVAAGLVPLKGTGLRLVLDDTSIKSIPSGDDPSLYIIHEYQLRDVVNVLWSAGAEAISINNERIVTSSSIYCVGSTILVNNTRLSAPFELTIIGDPQLLEDALNNPNNLKSFKSRVKVYGLQFKTTRQREVTVPAFSGSLVVKQATSDN